MNQAKVAAIFLTGVAIGGGGTYWAVTKQLKGKYEFLLDKEIEDVKSHYKIVREKDKYDSPEDLLAERKEKEAAKDEYITKVSAYEIETERNIGGTNPASSGTNTEERSIFDYATTKSPGGETLKTQETPYGVTYDEFDGENENYTKNTLTYYRGDDTVADEVDDIVDDVEELIGKDGLELFGSDPNQPDVAYIRNDKLHADYEVLLEERGYNEVVVGG